MQIRETYPDYEIVVAGDINSYLDIDGPLAQRYNSYPASKEEFTTLKKRTYTQAQFHKANTVVMESKDKVVTTLPKGECEVTTISGEKAK